MFELGQLRCFVAVAEELHFSRAALRLNMTQPPLSRQIQLLEHALGVRLFDRTRRSVRLTSAGRAFLAEARYLLQRAEGAALAARRAGRGDAGSVVIGFISAASYGFLPRIVALAHAELPDVELVLKEMHTVEQVEDLTARRIDLGLVRLPLDRRGVEALRVVREPFVLALPRGHALAARRRALTIRALDGERFIMFGSAMGPTFHELLTGLFRSAAVMPDIVQHVGVTHTALALVGAGVGLALVPESAQSLRFDGVVFRPIDLGPGIAAELHMIWRPDNENAALPAVRDLILRGCGAPRRN